MKPVVLSGFMGTGKSTVGPRLASRLGVPFVDTDAEIERRAGKTIPELWRAEGEAAFRAREAELVEELLAHASPRVLAFGGGTVTVERARRLATDRALVVTLTASLETVVARTPNISTRPNLSAAGDAKTRARELLASREAAYAECHLTIRTDALDVEGVVNLIAALVARNPLLCPLGTRSYNIDVCDDEPFRLREATAGSDPSSLILVTDANVEHARGPAISAALDDLGLRTTRVTLPPGEEHKTLSTVGAIWDAALAAGADREAVIVAVGGGVVGDLAGFAAACLLRGVRFVQVPTTLLAMVDASVGGKTGFDHAAGKNLIGAFHQPSAVVADLAHLQTLPAREFNAGLAEVVKVALATDADLLDRLERDARTLAAGDRSALAPIVRDAIRAKIRVVRDDERESGLRALLNLGHTVGHALEAHGGFTQWLHGEAVALGMIVELEAAALLGWTPPSLVQRTRDVLAALGLPTRVAASEVMAAWHFVGADKKRTRDAVRFAIVQSPGVARVERVSLTDLARAIQRAD
jgi:shikimate kinase/3-dehydroquinate synthase